MGEKEEEISPSDLEDEDAEAVNNVIPQKSRKTYEKEYSAFKIWMNNKNIKCVSEKVLLAYFSEKSKKVKPSSLWSYYSMLKSTLLVHENNYINKYNKLTSFLKQLTTGYKPKKSKIFESADIMRFLTDASDDDYLLLKVVAIFGLFGACRCDELYKLEVSHVEDKQSVLIVSLFDTKTKKDRSFCITDSNELSMLGIVRKYISLRPVHALHNKFFINYRQQKCTVQVVGINTMYKVPKKIANFLKLPNSELYTAHCFRRSAATMMAGADLISVKRMGGWRSSSVAETYFEESVSSKIDVLKRILSGVKEDRSSEKMCENIDDSLANLAESVPALWNKSSQYFKNKVKKENSIKEVANILGTTPDIVVSRFKALREKYRKEKLKIAGQSESQQADSEQWHLFETLCFLDAVQLKRSRMESSMYSTRSTDSSAFCSPSSSTLTVNTREDDEQSCKEILFLSPSGSDSASQWAPEIDDESQDTTDDDKQNEIKPWPFLKTPSTTPIIAIKRKREEENNEATVNKLFEKIETAAGALDSVAKSQMAFRNQDYVDAFGAFVVGNLRRLNESDRDEAIFDITQILTNKLVK